MHVYLARKVPVIVFHQAFSLGFGPSRIRTRASHCHDQMGILQSLVVFKDDLLILQVDLGHFSDHETLPESGRQVYASFLDVVWPENCM